MVKRKSLHRPESLGVMSPDCRDGLRSAVQTCPVVALLGLNCLRPGGTVGALLLRLPVRDIVVENRNHRRTVDLLDVCAVNQHHDRPELDRIFVPFLDALT